MFAMMFVLTTNLGGVSDNIAILNVVLGDFLGDVHDNVGSLNNDHGNVCADVGLLPVGSGDGFDSIRMLTDGLWR